MSVHIIIDGYNLIRQSDKFSPLDRKEMQMGRESLVNTLAAYKKLRHHKITVVFDGSDAPLFLERRDRVQGIDIKFSRGGEQADTVIKRMVTREKEKALVVSSDRDVVNFSESQGAATISSPDFEKKIAMAAYMTEKGADIEIEENTGWIPTTKKKGPSRRLSKKERRNKVKIRKL